MNPLDAVGTGCVDDVEVGTWIVSKTRSAGLMPVQGVVVEILEDSDGVPVFVVWRQGDGLVFDTMLADDVDTERLEDDAAFSKSYAAQTQAQILRALPRRVRPEHAEFVMVAGRMGLLAMSPGTWLPNAERRYRAAAEVARADRNAS